MRSHKLVRQPANPASHKIRLTKKDCLLRIYLFDAAGCQSRLADLHKPIGRRITAVDYLPLASPLNMFGPMEICRRLQAKSCLMVVIDCDERLGIQAMPSSGKFHHRDNRCKRADRHRRCFRAHVVDFASPSPTPPRPLAVPYDR